MLFPNSTRCYVCTCAHRYVLPIVTRLQGVAQVSPSTGGIVYTFDDVVVTAASEAEEVSGERGQRKFWWRIEEERGS